MNGEVEGNPNTINSFRAEAQGLVNLLWSPGIRESTKIYLDNKSVVKKVNEDYPLHPMQSEWELLEPARRKIKNEHLQVQHVKGHQDTKKKTLTPQEKLNIQADKLAEEAHNMPQMSGYTPTGYTVLLYINGNRITTKITKEILQAATTPEIRQYYMNKYKWNEVTLQNMDWEGQQKAVQTFSSSTQKTLHKYIHGWLPTGNHMSRRYKIPNKCPYCYKEETEKHLLTCSGQSGEKKEFKKKLTKVLKILQTEPTLHAVLMRLLFTEEPVLCPADAWLQQTIQEQQRIGRDMIWKGYLTQQWGDYMENHYRTKGHERHYSGTLWTKRVIQCILTYGIEAWHRRNERLHQHNKKENPHRQQLENQIREKYQRHEATPEILPCLYKHPLTTLIRKQTRYLQRWLEIMQDMESFQEVQEKRREGQDIRKLLQRTTTNPG